ncbi:MAG TPA: site-2 protease family protein [Candidatus Moranbacteria bacterium]|jgi:Zn-dependent protease|nr:site-2 protease family protein [Candidatus Moranbacteria bacterium]HOF42533.1 site-2 protease family protein [Candidatus Moranbacteria bacterium]HPX94326.1 site-2 protease family protein [Candidatus Moranbacteria bacterium]HQB59967.1 site-2 protease family protein [Candidatus Moranbacteria bacterium]
MDLNSVILIGFYVLILIYSIIVHEVSHGFVALWLGDATAKYSGRLNFNPISHIDIWGSIIVPLAMLVTTGFAFGWAKPVPYNPYNLRNQKWGPAMVAFGGPASNIVIALVSAVLAKFIMVPVAVKAAIITGISNASWSQISATVSGSFGSIFFALLMIVIFWNVLLAFFNLIPFPPLDGSKLLFSVFPIRTGTMAMLEQYGFILLLLFIIVFSGPLGFFLTKMLSIFYGIAI